MKPSELRTIIREEAQLVLKEISAEEFDQAQKDFDGLYTKVEELHQKYGTELEDHSEPDFVTFSRYIKALYKSIDNMQKFLRKREARAKQNTDPDFAGIDPTVGN
jgi:hypothetical protein